MAITEPGEVFTWGYGTSGCLGTGDKTSLYFPKKIPELSQIVYGEAGAYHNGVVD